MPLPKAPTKPAAPFTLTDDVRVRNLRPKAAKPTHTDASDFQPDLLNPVRDPEDLEQAASAGAGAGAGLDVGTGAVAAMVAETSAAAESPKPAKANTTPRARTRSTAAARLEAAPAKPPRAARMRATSLGNDAQATPARLFVLDTNVLMHDPSSLFRFEEHDIFLPMVTLEELDNNKKGMTEVARNARQASRSIEALIGDLGSSLSPMRTSASSTQNSAAPLVHLIEDGVRLDKLGNREATGRLRLQTTTLASTALPASLASTKADNQILGVVHALQERAPDSDVVLVSKDINMRIKARALGLRAEDYFNDQVVDDTDLLYSGVLQLPADFWDRHGKGMESWQQGGVTYYRITGPLVRQFLLNQFVWFEGQLPLAAQVRELNGSTAVLQTLRDFGHHKNSVWGISARNREQNFALNLLTNPDVDFVSLLGQAGTGKTLLALAAGLSQVLESKRYSEIIMTRATVPVGEDIGYLPGTEEEKMQPWMGALEDNLEVLNKGESGGDWGRSAANDLIKSRVKVKSMSFMRGRTFLGKYLIIDEAQNLTPKQMKTLVTRAGPGTKVICLGNIAQIDTPYLTEGSSGLTYVVDRFKGWGHAGHITLQRGERSRLADYAADAL